MNRRSNGGVPELIVGSLPIELFQQDQELPGADDDHLVDTIESLKLSITSHEEVGVSRQGSRDDKVIFRMRRLTGNRCGYRDNAPVVSQRSDSAIALT